MAIFLAGRKTERFICSCKEKNFCIKRVGNGKVHHVASRVCSAFRLRLAEEGREFSSVRKPERQLPVGTDKVST